MKRHSSEMKKAIQHILTKHNRLQEFEKGICHLRLEKPGFMPLVIERHSKHVTVTHYSNQNGDLVADPDMEFEIDSQGNWQPVAIQLWNGTYRTCRQLDGDREAIDFRELRDQLQFAKLWAGNLRDQGW